MSDKYDGGPAFPVPLNPGEAFKEMGPADGISVRDYFAAKAMQSLIINSKTLSPDVPLSARAYEIADYMLKQRKANER